MNENVILINSLMEIFKILVTKRTSLILKKQIILIIGYIYIWTIS